ncbi:MAG: tRNA (adenosine(37)-N6)-threonylcarbamoyltransferase complex dimerization subunit type 1 TsaB [Prolixibacteraceae bacterium]|nr:tRNA (adenosine(37)-N6)-threonylcarbamoyltransferase complex dimerization subunit type 1 TsaB [Prolixibacteraceae bacterium]
MALLLCIESSTEWCSVALSENGIVKDFREEGSGMNHARLLTAFIDELLKANQLTPILLDGVAVSEGPGSYTGLRIGISAAKAICYAIGKPLLAVSPLEAMAHHVVNNASAYKIDWRSTDWLVPMMDARRMEVYQAVFSPGLEWIKPVEAVAVEADTFSENLQQHRMFFFGNGAAKCMPVIQHSNAQLIEGIYTSARHMPPLAEALFLQQKFEDVAYFEPYYLKEFMATTPKNKVL